MIWILNRGFGAERMPSQRGKVYCTGWCWYIGRSKRGHRGKANSAPRLGVSLGARARPRIANLSRLLDARPHILVLYLFSNITPSWRGAARWANLAPSQISNIAISHRTRPRLPAGRFEDPATVKEASSSGSLDRAQHPSSNGA
jgi:hypothetical protein